jgi:hypothetical protein
VKNLQDGPHYELRRGTQQQAIDYSSKSDTRVAGPWEGGQRAATEQGKRSDLAEAVSLISGPNGAGMSGLKRLREERPIEFVKFHRGLTALAGAIVPTRQGPPNVRLLFGPSGCGKSRSYHDNYGVDACVISASGGFWFDGYDGGEHVLIDDFDGRSSHWTLQNLLQVLDRYVIKVPIKGSFIYWAPQEIYVTTNYHPREWYEWQGREQQWPALQRRFTHVTWWCRGDGDRSTPPFIMESGVPHDKWDHFWNGFEKKEKDYFKW